METELQHLAPPHPLRHSIHCATSDPDDARYTSLKDIIALAAASPRASDGSFAYGLEFDSFSVPIRNQLLKHAASAYLQSVAIVAPRNQSCASRVWRSVRRRAAELGSGWRRCAAGASDACSRIVRRVLACVGGVGDRRRVPRDE